MVTGTNQSIRKEEKMYILDHPVMKRVATILLDLVAVSLLFLVICLGDKASAKETRNDLSEYRFENKDIRIDCKDKTPGGCEYLVEELKKIDERRRREIERAKKRVDYEFASGTLI